MAHDHRVEHPAVLVGELILAQLADARVGLGRNIARCRLQLTRQNFMKVDLPEPFAPIRP